MKAPYLCWKTADRMPSWYGENKYPFFAFSWYSPSSGFLLSVAFGYWGFYNLSISPVCFWDVKRYTKTTQHACNGNSLGDHRGSWMLRLLPAQINDRWLSRPILHRRYCYCQAKQHLLAQHPIMWQILTRVCQNLWDYVPHSAFQLTCWKCYQKCSQTL